MYIQIHNNIPKVTFMLMGDNTFILTNIHKTVQYSKQQYKYSMYCNSEMSAMCERTGLSLHLHIMYKHMYNCTHMWWTKKTWATVVFDSFANTMMRVNRKTINSILSDNTNTHLRMYFYVRSWKYERNIHTAYVQIHISTE